VIVTLSDIIKYVYIIDLLQINIERGA